MDRNETISTNPTTGGQKGEKLARFDLIPVNPLIALAEHFGRGARKYEDRNWQKGYAWSKSFAAMMRHAWLWWSGEDIDAETGSNHMVAVAWHAFALLEFCEAHPELDDRPKAPAPEPVQGGIVSGPGDLYLVNEDGSHKLIGHNASIMVHHRDYPFSWQVGNVTHDNTPPGEFAGSFSYPTELLLDDPAFWRKLGSETEWMPEDFPTHPSTIGPAHETTTGVDIDIEPTASLKPGGVVRKPRLPW